MNNKVNAAFLAISKPVDQRRRSTKVEASALRGSADDPDCIHLVANCTDFNSPVTLEGKVGTPTARVRLN